MSKIDNNQIIKVFKLARIRPENDDIADTAKKLNSILDFVETLSEINTDNVDEEQGANNANILMRKDEVTVYNIRDEVMSNTKGQYGCFVVPKVVDEA